MWTRSLHFAGSTEEVCLAAAALALPDGDYYGFSQPYTTQAVNSVRTRDEADIADETVDPGLSGEVYTEDASAYDSLAHFPVVETLYREGDTAFGNISIKNTTGKSIDIKSYIEKPLPFEFDSSDKVQVLIYHTHTSESYLFYDEGYYHEGFYPRSNDEDKNMVRVGEAIAQGLQKSGIGVVHAKEVHDNPKYTGAYSRSRSTIQKYLDQYPDIKVILDIHRDSISYSKNNGKIKPTFEVQGNKAAQIMIMTGCSSSDFDFWQENLNFALKLQNTAEQMYPGMTRPLYLGNFTYNMNVSNGSLLIEVGTDANTLSEAVYTGELLSNVLAKVLQSG